MKPLFWLLMIFAVAVAIALIAHFNDGHVLIFYHPYQIELSLNFFIALVIIGFISLYALLRLVLTTIELPSRARSFSRRRRSDKARTAMIDAIKNFFEGRYARSEKAANEAYDLGEAPALNALLAARAAHQMREFEKRDNWLSKSENLGDEFKNARLMTQAELLLDEHRYRDALRALEQLHAHGARYIAALRIALRAQIMAQNWDEVLHLIRQLEKRKALPDHQSIYFRNKAHQENMRLKAFDVQSLIDYWRKIPEEERLDNQTASVAAKHFIRLGGCRQAHEIIEKSLAREWSSELVLLYGECLGQDTRQQVELAEKWLKSYPGDANLLRTLGRLCAYQELWGKAQSYLEASLAIQESRATHLDLARLFDQLQRTEQANQHYRKSADMALSA